MDSPVFLMGTIAVAVLIFYIVLKILSKSRDTRWELEHIDGNKSIVVLVHGLSGRKKFESTIQLAKATLPNSDLLVFDYDSRILSNEDPYEIANVVERQIHEAYLKHKYSEIVLVGYSMGGMLTRKALLWGNGFEEDRKKSGLRGKREWVEKVSRYVSLAAINRGWSISPRPGNMTSGTYLQFRFGDWVARFTSTGKLLRAFKRGSPFISDARVQWIFFCRDSKNTYNVPQTIHLLGDNDDIVNKDDSMDLGVAKNTIFVTLLQTGHRQIGTALNGGTLQADKDRREKVTLAIAGQIEELDADETVPFIEDLSTTKIVYVVHGIRDYGDWTDQIRTAIMQKALVNNLSLRVVNLKYGRFPMLPFLLYWDRQKNVRLFMDEYTENMARFPNARVFDFIGHSNGTYILASALKRYKTPCADKVFFAGSVVPKHYTWRALADDGRVKHVANVVASGDWVVAIFPRFLEQIADWKGVQPSDGFLDIGSAGFRGFQDSMDGQGRIENIQFAKGSHGTGIDVANIKKLDAIVGYIVYNDKTGFSIFKNDNMPVAWLDFFSNISWFVWILLLGLLLGLGLLFFSLSFWIGCVYIALIIALVNSV